MNKSRLLLFASLFSCQVVGDVDINNYPPDWPRIQVDMLDKNCLKILGKYEYDGIFFQSSGTHGSINIHNVFRLSDHGFNANSVASFSVTKRENEFFIDIDVMLNNLNLSNSAFSLGSNCNNGWLAYKETISGSGDGTPSLSDSTFNISVASDGSLVIEEHTLQKERAFLFFESSYSLSGWYKFSKITADK